MHTIQQALPPRLNEPNAHSTGHEPVPTKLTNKLSHTTQTRGSQPHTGLQLKQVHEFGRPPRGEQHRHECSGY
jgi:hypothetical protein